MRIHRRKVTFVEFVIILASLAVAVMIVLGLRRFYPSTPELPPIDEIPGSYKASNPSRGLDQDINHVADRRCQRVHVAHVDASSMEARVVTRGDQEPLARGRLPRN